MRDSTRLTDYSTPRETGCWHPTGTFIEFKQEEIEQSIPSRFEQQVAKYPDRIAVKTKYRTVTYHALNESANRLARAILAQGGEKEEPIALLLEHDVGVVEAIFAVLKTGRIYIPLDVTFPRARLASMIEATGARLIVTNRKNLSLTQEVAGEGRRILNADEVDPAISGENIGLSISPDTLAVVIYTSGSTGEPKGVVHSHRNVLHNVMNTANAHHICADDRATLLASFSTGQSLTDTHTTLLNGAGLYPWNIKEEGLVHLASWLIEEKITIYRSSATAFRSFVETLSGGERFPDLRMLKLGSEPILKRDIEAFNKYLSRRCVFVNALSITESLTVRLNTIRKEMLVAGNSVPVGYALPGKEVLLLDNSGKPVGFDEIGEIAIKSPYLSLGYWRRPDLTSAVFIPDAETGERIYHSGDLGRMSPDGCLEHRGRKDFQVEIRGYRIELAEVEAALIALDYVKEVAVVSLEYGRDDNRLVAYLVLGGNGRPTVTALRRTLGEKLPGYMIPAAFVFLDALPVSPGGKLDRRALPKPADSRPELETAFVAPFETVEHQLVQIWEELLPVRPIGIRDSFFDLGGHSLLAAQMMPRIEAVCGQKIPLTTLLAGPTIEHLAKALMKHCTEEQNSVLVQIQSGGSKPPIFFLHGDFEGGGFYCLNLARHLGKDRPFYALAPFGMDGSSIPPTIETVAASYIEIIREVQPKGPYVLGGLCKGGVTVYEMARQLQGQGEQVDLVVIIGSTVWNTYLMRFLHRLAFALGYLIGLDTEGRARLFLVLRDHWVYWRNTLDDDWNYKRERLKQVATLSFGEQLAWAFRQMKRAARWPARRILLGRGPEISVTKTGPDQQYETANLPHYKHLLGLGYNIPYYKQLSSYVPGPYSGRVVLFWAAEEPARHPYKPAWRRADAPDPTLGWGRVASDLEIEILPGVTNTSITKDVKILVERMKSYLDRVQSNGQQIKVGAAGMNCAPLTGEKIGS